MTVCPTEADREIARQLMLDHIIPPPGVPFAAVQVHAMNAIATAIAAARAPEGYVLVDGEVRAAALAACRKKCSFPAFSGLESKCTCSDENDTDHPICIQWMEIARAALLAARRGAAKGV